MVHISTTSIIICFSTVDIRPIFHKRKSYHRFRGSRRFIRPSIRLSHLPPQPPRNGNVIPMTSRVVSSAICCPTVASFGTGAICPRFRCFCSSEESRLTVEGFNLKLAVHACVASDALCCCTKPIKITSRRCTPAASAYYEQSIRTVGFECES